MKPIAAGAAGGGCAPPRFKCWLVGPDKCEIFLTGGPQTVGRGHGGADSKRISHRQLCVIANTHTGVSILRGLHHTKNDSGVALGGGAWQPIGGEDEVELVNGDMVALLLDQGADEENTTAEGVFMYRSERIAYPEEKSWLSWSG